MQHGKTGNLTKTQAAIFIGCAHGPPMIELGCAMPNKGSSTAPSECQDDKSGRRAVLPYLRRRARCIEELAPSLVINARSGLRLFFEGPRKRVKQVSSIQGQRFIRRRGREVQKRSSLRRSSSDVFAS